MWKMIKSSLLFCMSIAIYIFLFLLVGSLGAIFSFIFIIFEVDGGQR